MVASSNVRPTRRSLATPLGIASYRLNANCGRAAFHRGHHRLRGYPVMWINESEFYAREN
jgi:hypothetical protein